MHVSVVVFFFLFLCSCCIAQRKRTAVAEATTYMLRYERAVHGPMRMYVCVCLCVLLCSDWSRLYSTEHTGSNVWVSAYNFSCMSFFGATSHWKDCQVRFEWQMLLLLLLFRFCCLCLCMCPCLFLFLASYLLFFFGYMLLCKFCFCFFFHALELFWSASFTQKELPIDLVHRLAELIFFNDNVEGNKMHFMTLTRWSVNLHFHSWWTSTAYKWIFRTLYGMPF